MSTENYIQKKAAFDRATEDRDTIISFLATTVGAMQRNPEMFHFSNCDNGFPPEVVMSRASQSVDANRWPTAKQIQQAFSSWHRLKQDVMNAWRALKPEEQRVMRSPMD